MKLLVSCQVSPHSCGNEGGGDELTTIPLRKATRDRLKHLGKKGDTYDTILNQLIDQAAPPPKKPQKPTQEVVDFEAVD